MNGRLLLWLIPGRLLNMQFRGLAWVALCLVLLVGAWFSADSPFGKASGIYEIRYRAEMAAEAFFWMVRAVHGASKPEEVARDYRGYIERGQNEYLLIYLYSGNGRVRQVVSLANVNNHGANLGGFAERYKGKPLRFELYKLPTERQPRALIWDVDRPLNLEVIEDGVGPDVNPPTNIVDWIFARHYWHQAKMGLN